MPREELEMGSGFALPCQSPQTTKFFFENLTKSEQRI